MIRVGQNACYSKITYLAGSSLLQSVLDPRDNCFISVSVVNDGIPFASCNEPLYKGLTSSSNSDDGAIRDTCQWLLSSECSESKKS
jgi:hypothetical protein